MFFLLSFFLLSVKLVKEGQNSPNKHGSTGVEVFIGSKAPCLFCFVSCTPEGRGEEMGGSGNFKNKAH